MSEPFQPIKASNYYDREEGVTALNESNEQEIVNLLMGRKVTKVDGEHLLLDDGTVIKAIGHEGGCACSAGDYDLSVLNGVDNVITRVEFDYQPTGDYERGKRERRHPDDPEDEWVTVRVRGPITPAEFDYLIDALTALRPGFTGAASPVPSPGAGGPVGGGK